MRRSRRLAALAALLLFPAPALAAQFSCDEPGVLAAIAAGGGPHSFACAGPTTVVTSGEIAIAQTVELDGGGLLTLSGGGAHRIFSVPPPTVFWFFVTLRSLALRDGYTTDSGGCIYSESILTLDHVHVSGCHGGGIYSSSDLTLTDSSVVGNYGGGIFVADGFGATTSNALTLTRSVVEGNQAGFESGGIYTAAGFATITESTIRGNRAPKAAGISFHAFSNSISASITRSTISGNRATTPLSAGGVYAFGAVVNVSNSTFANNPPVAIRTDGFPPIVGPTPTDLILDHSTIVAAAGSAPSAIIYPLEDFPLVRLRNSLIRGRCNRSAISQGTTWRAPVTRAQMRRPT